MPSNKIKLLKAGLFVSLIGCFFILYPVPESDMLTIAWASKILFAIKTHMTLPFILITLYCFYNFDTCQVRERWLGTLLGGFLGFIIGVVFSISMAQMLLPLLNPSIPALSIFLSMLFLFVSFFIGYLGLGLGQFYGIIIDSIMQARIS